MNVYQKILFTKEECEFIINYCNNNIIPKPVIKGVGVKYDYFKILYDGDIKWIFDKIYNSFEELTNIPIKDKSMQLSINRYKIGDVFTKHIDRDAISPQRMWNIDIVLNTDFEGGEHYYFIDGIKYLSNKKVGNLIIYDSSIPYGVTKVSNGVRLSIVKILDLEHLIYKTTSLI